MKMDVHTYLNKFKGGRLSRENSLIAPTLYRQISKRLSTLDEDIYNPGRLSLQKPVTITRSKSTSGKGSEIPEPDSPNKRNGLFQGKDGKVYVSKDESISRRWVDVDAKFTEFLKSHNFAEKSVLESYYLPKEKKMECILQIHNTAKALMKENYDIARREESIMTQNRGVFSMDDALEFLNGGDNEETKKIMNNKIAPLFTTSKLPFIYYTYKIDKAAIQQYIKVAHEEHFFRTVALQFELLAE